MFTPTGLLRKKLKTPSFVGVSTTVLTSGNTLTIAKPTTLPGDWMLFFMWGDVSTISSAPSGWTQVQYQTATFEGAGQHAYLWIKRATESEPVSYSWILSSGAGFKLAAILSYRDGYLAQPDTSSASVISAAGSNLHSSAALTTSYLQGRLVYAWCLNRDSTTTVAVNAGPASMASRALITGTGYGRADLGLAIYDEAQDAAGSSGPKLLTTTTGDVRSIGLRCALRAVGT